MVRSRDARWFTKLALTAVDARWLTKLALSAVAVSAMACADQSNPVGIAPTFHGQGSEHRWGREHHSRHGHHPWTGRSGSAAITAYALFGANGTNLTVTSYREADSLFTTPVGCIEKIQVKVYTPQGRLVSTQNFNDLDRRNVGSSVSVLVRGAQVGYRLALKVDVGCIDRRRTDVVDAHVEVIAPNTTDAEVVWLTVPGTPLTSAPVTIRAFVTVTRGLAAASGNCVLYVDGSPIATLGAVTIAAGDSIPCTFTPTFATAGTVQVSVAFENVSPTDLDPENNSAETEMPVYSEPPTVEFTADVYDDTLAYHDLYMHSLRAIPDSGKLYDTLPDALPGLTVAQTVDSLYPVQDSVYTSADMIGNYQHAQVVGIINTRVTFPLTTVSVSQRSGATTYHTQTWSNVGSASSECADLLEGTVDLSICAYAPDQGFPNGKTVITYKRDTSSASERLVGYKVGQEPEVAPSHCVPTSTDINDNCHTVNTPQGPALVRYSSTYTFTLTVQDPAHRFTATVETALSLSRTVVGDSPDAFYEVQEGGPTGLMRWREQQGELTDRIRYSGPISNLTRLTTTVAP